MSRNSTTFSIYETLESVKQSPVVFDKVPEQYVKNQDVIAYFSVPKEINVNENDDRIGLMRVYFRFFFFILIIFLSFRLVQRI